MNDYVNLKKCVTGFSLDNDYVHCISDDSIIKIDRHTKEVVYSTKLFKKEGFSRNLIANDKSLFIRDFYTLYIIDKQDYSKVSILQLGTDLSSDICGMTIDKNNIYTCIRNGQLRIIDINSHTIKGSYHISPASIWGLGTYKNLLIGGSVDGKILFVDNSKFEILKTISLSKQNIGSISIHNNYLFAASQDKALYLVDIISGECIVKKRKVHNRMFDCVGIYKDNFITISYPSREIAFWNKETLELNKLINIPLKLSGRAVLENDMLYIASRNINGIISLDMCSG